jgi:uncharacterized membrane protein YadS
MQCWEKLVKVLTMGVGSCQAELSPNVRSVFLAVLVGAMIGYIYSERCEFKYTVKVTVKVMLK